MSNQKPLLSIIIANYNYGTYLRDCLDSIIAQSFKNFEVIIIDDCSSDISPEILLKYRNTYPEKIKVFFNEKNKGVTLTRHEGIQKARGEFITTLDSDDYYFSEKKLENEIEKIRFIKHLNNEDIIAFSNIIQVNEDKSEIGPLGEWDDIREGMIFDEIISRSCMIPRDFIFKKNMYLDIGGYDLQLPIYEDWDLKIKLSKKYKFYFAGGNGTAYRRHRKGLSSLTIRKNVKWMNKVFKTNYKLIPQKKRPEVKNKFNDHLNKMKENYKFQQNQKKKIT